ncbi:xylitol dehydrogenase [Fomitopsis serialis]|uniref:xylitol dehydrogenase n=1 Tax=Fomitopsis serialis TaxID=139415 RepID=UPI0020079907|nr:xylitol dehydrogenase [Neoantrodia serialis]KAH9938211.1 xylitol dehydrogenase [Neoantrodia serialis]
MSDNPSFVLRGINDVVFEQRPIPEIADDEVLVDVKKTGICGSDVHYMVAGRIGHFVVEKPMVLGHESAGIVSKVGPAVKDLKVGDRVAMEPGATCRKCDACKSGRYELCPDMIFAATPPYDGTLARYYNIPADIVYKLPDHLTLEDGAMMEPLSVAIHAVANIADFHANRSIVVFGAGPVGLLCMAVAKALGASRVIAVDIVQNRLDFAKEYAATDIYLPPPMEKDEPRIRYSERNAKKLMADLGIEERGAKSIDLVVDASGAEVSMQTGVLVAKIGGTFVQLGMGSPEAVLPITTMLTKEITWKGSFRYGPGDYPLAIALAAQGKIDLKALVTHRYTFDEAVEAFQTTRLGKSADGKGVIKAVISGPGVSPNDL